jgi:ADP-ribose pyrophosphatase
MSLQRNQSLKGEKHMKEKKVTVLSREILYQGFYQIQRYTLQTELFSGPMSQPYQRELLVQPAAAAALLYDPQKKAVVLIEQFRLGTLGANNSPWILEVVAGLQDKTRESDEDLIKREIYEEAGAEVISLHRICSYFVSPGASSEHLTLFCAIIDSTKIKEFAGLDSEHEDIRVHVVPVDEALAMLADGRINNGTTIIALQWLALNLDKISAASA